MSISGVPLYLDSCEDAVRRMVRLSTGCANGDDRHAVLVAVIFIELVTHGIVDVAGHILIKALMRTILSPSEFNMARASAQTAVRDTFAGHFRSARIVCRAPAARDNFSSHASLLAPYKVP